MRYVPYVFDCDNEKHKMKRVGSSLMVPCFITSVSLLTKLQAHLCADEPIQIQGNQKISRSITLADIKYMLRVLVIILLILLYFTLFDEALLISCFFAGSGMFLKSKDGIVGTRPAICMSQLRVVRIT